jgi:hypothetical protein
LCDQPAPDPVRGEHTGLAGLTRKKDLAFAQGRWRICARRENPDARWAEGWPPEHARSLRKSAPMAGGDRRPRGGEERAGPGVGHVTALGFPPAQSLPDAVSFDTLLP